MACEQNGQGKEKSIYDVIIDGNVVQIVYKLLPFCSWGRDSTVNITTGNELDGRRSIRGRNKIILFSPASGPALGPTQPSIQRVLGSKTAGAWK
jgi:hypothetical protein